MKTEELVAALRQCGCVGAGCAGCPFEIRGAIDEDWCGDALVRAAADRLEEYVDRCVWFSEEIMVLREQQRNDPLTLDELKEMDGEPVFLDVASGVWGLVDTDDFVVWLDRGGSIDISKIAGKAYRHKPEEVSNGKDG